MRKDADLIIRYRYRGITYKECVCFSNNQARSQDTLRSLFRSSHNSKQITKNYTTTLNKLKQNEDRNKSFCYYTRATCTMAADWRITWCIAYQDDDNAKVGLRRSGGRELKEGRDCGGGNRGNGICPTAGECCSECGWCSSSSAQC